MSTPSITKEQKSPKAPKVPKVPKEPKSPKVPKEPKSPKVPKSPKNNVVTTEVSVVEPQLTPKKTRAKKNKVNSVMSQETSSENINIIVDNNVLKNNKIDHTIIEHNVIDNNVNSNEIFNFEGAGDNTEKPLEETYENNIVIGDSIIDPVVGENTHVKQAGKKRGRKPKGGKIIQQITTANNNKENKPNIILHLKCSIKDLDSAVSGNSQIESFNFSSNKNELAFEVINNTKIPTSTLSTLSTMTTTPQHYLHSEIVQPTSSYENTFDNTSITPSINSIVSMNTIMNMSMNMNTNMNTNMGNTNINDYDDCCYDNDDNNDCDVRDVWKKLKHLEHNLHINNISDKKSACFWCTYEFDNPPIYIPKHYIKDSYQVYGCFCSPECGVAHLMEESIDSSTKFERYQLINHIYAKIYNYNRNIKPAPNPYYMLSRYYGNLSIQEYRSLLRNERLFLIVDKPLTRILPELHEDNDDFILNNKIIPSNNYQIKKKKVLKKPQTKNNIVNEKFGMQASILTM